jgi:phosphoenolpyruvate carboxylase
LENFGIIYDEFFRNKTSFIENSRTQELMENYPDGVASIQIRERIVLPLLTIQQYALSRINELNKEPTINIELIKVYEKLLPVHFWNTNAVETRLKIKYYDFN